MFEPKCRMKRQLGVHSRSSGTATTASRISNAINCYTLIRRRLKRKCITMSLVMTVVCTDGIVVSGDFRRTKVK